MCTLSGSVSAISFDMTPNTRSRRSGNTGQLAAKLAEVLVDSADLHKRGEAALAFARENFSPAHTAQRFESALAEAVAGGRARQEP